MFATMALAGGVAAAACSGGQPVGIVGTSLSAMGAQVTLAAVYDPATVSNSSVAQPAYGHNFVAASLNVRNVSDSAVDMATIYKISKLRDNKRRDHVPSPSGTVTECQRLDSLGQLQPHQSTSGCVIFDVSMLSRPVKLFIESSPQVSWAIKGGAIQAEPAGVAAIGPVPATTPPPAPGNGISSGSTGDSGTGNSGAGGAPGSGGTASCTGNTGTGSTGSGCQGGAGTQLNSGFAIVTTSLPGATPGGAYSDQLVASGGATPYHWRRISGTLPKGIHIGSAGLVFGRPRAAPGTYSFTVEVKDSTPHGHLEAVQNLSLTVS